MKITVYLGTGGVGKTSVAAATALAQARGHAGKSLVLTIDPARRLRTALRLEEGALEQSVALDPPGAGELWAALLDVRATLDDAVRAYARKGLVDRILNHPIYAQIADSLVGMQELMAIERIDQLRRRGFEYIVVDTAPSRHAIEFLDKPMAFADLVGSGWVKLIGRTYQFVQRTGMASLGRKSIDLYARVEALLGANLVRQVLDFYSIFVSIAEGYASRAEKTVALLKDPAVTDFRVVTTPQKALRDAHFFDQALAGRGFRLDTIFINRLWPPATGETLVPGLGADVLAWYSSVRQAHDNALADLRAGYRGRPTRLVPLDELPRDVDGIEALGRIAGQLKLQ